METEKPESKMKRGNVMGKNNNNIEGIGFIKSRKPEATIDKISELMYAKAKEYEIERPKILVDDGFVPSDVKKVIVGPCNDRPGATKLGNNQSITQEEAEALEAIYQAGYEIEFALIKEASIGSWSKFRGQFGFN
mgnify:CR=1 FL=1